MHTTVWSNTPRIIPRCQILCYGLIRRSTCLFEVSVMIRGTNTRNRRSIRAQIFTLTCYNLELLLGDQKLINTTLFIG
jgi:hypothetical protein